MSLANRFISGIGSLHTNAPHAIGKPYYREDYIQLAIADIERMLKSPQSVAKEHAQWAIFSNLQTRNHEQQLINGSFGMLWADLDKLHDSFTIEVVTTLLSDITTAKAYVYHTSSSTTLAPCYRVLIPLNEPLNGADFKASQRVLNDKLEMRGLTPDRSTERTGQVCYLPNIIPNKPDVDYSYRIIDGQYFDVLTVFSEELAVVMSEQAKQAAEQQEATRQAMAKCAERCANGTASPMDAYNSLMPLDVLLLNYGYVKSGKQYRSPNQQSKSAAVTIKGNKWVSLSESDIECGIGKASNTGCYGDAFDLYAFYECDNDRTKALKYLGDSLQDVNGVSITKANQRKHMQSIQADRTKHVFKDVVAPNLQIGKSVINEGGARLKQGDQLLSPSDTVEHFKDCTYISSLNRVLMPSGELVKREQFNVLKGGYEFVITEGTDKAKITDEPFKAFTNNRAVSFEHVHRLAFRPENSSKFWTDDGLKYVNAYIPAHGKTVIGDATPFLKHLGLLVPDANDREILLSWCAHTVQNVGSKAKWSPLLVGTEGNGKSLIGQVLRYAIGARWTTTPNAANLLGSKFNTWIENTLLAIIEEVHVRGRAELMDSLKPLITDETIEIEGKGRDGYTGDNRCNILMCSNYKDAIMKTVNDRRYCIFYTAQQTAAEKIRDGLTDDYFNKLWHWLEKENGFAIAAHYLKTYKISASVPIKGHAPRTTSTDEATKESRTITQDLIMHHVEHERVGFRGGLVTSAALTEMFKDAHHKCAPRTQGKAMEELGYLKHPTSPRIKLNGEMMTVYVKTGHLAQAISTVDGLRDRLLEVNRELAPHEMRSYSHV